MIKSRKLILLLFTLLLVLVACVDSGAENNATNEAANNAAPAENEANTAPVAEEPAAEEEESAPVAEMEPIYIGGIHPLTGGLAADGIQMDNAIQMAIAELNEAGGVLGGRMFRVSFR